MWEPLLLLIIIIITEMIRIIGKMLPASIPLWRLSPAIWVTFPTRLGPMEPPRSPAIASNANIAVPPLGNFFDEMLIDPGHMIPTEKPQNMHPKRLIMGLADSEAII